MYVCSTLTFLMATRNKTLDQFTTHFNSPSDLLCCSALARAMAPVAVRSLLLRLQQGTIRSVYSSLVKVSEYGGQISSRQWHCHSSCNKIMVLKGGTVEHPFLDSLDPLTTDDAIWRRLTLAACYQLAQSVLIGFALAKKVK